MKICVEATTQGSIWRCPKIDNRKMDPEDLRRKENSLPLLVEAEQLEAGTHGKISSESAKQNVSPIEESHRETPFLIQRKPVTTERPLAETKTPNSAQSPARSRTIAWLKQRRFFRHFRINPFRSHVFKYWWLETGACFLILASIAAVVVTLSPHQGKPLPNWPYHSSVNTIIAVYVVVLKSTILLVTAEGLGQLKWKWLEKNRPLQDLTQFDDATRGPLGALGLLWRLRHRHPLSSIAAVVSLLVLIVDPFVQQIIHYYDCGVLVDGLPGTIPRTNVFRQTSNESQFLAIDPTLQAAIVDGVVSPGRVIQADCPTGNCSFGDYSTVAFCSSCRDVTEELSIHMAFVNSNYSGAENLSSVMFENGTNRTTMAVIPGGFLSNTNMSISTSLPSGLSVFNNPGTTVNLTVVKGFLPPEVGGQITNPNLTVEVIVGKQYENIDPATGQGRLGCDNGEKNNTWYCKGYGVASCDLFPCVRSYTSMTSAGELQEIRDSAVDSTGFIWGNAPEQAIPPHQTAPLLLSVSYISIVDTKCLSVSERQNLVRSNYSLDQDTRWLPYNMTFDPSGNLIANASFPQSMLAHGCLYAFDVSFIDNLQSTYMEALFTGIVQGDNGPDIIPGSDILERLNGSESLQAIYDGGNASFDSVSQIFDNVSDSLTDYFRLQTQPKYNTPAQGAVYHDQTCLGVRWPWLAFPTTVALLTLAFFVALLIESRPRSSSPSAPVWKSSPLALLFHGLELQHPWHVEGTGVDRMDGMDKLAKEISIRLENTDDGLKLLEVAGGGEAKKERGI